uniref:Uncharacterized protein ORF-c21_035 n=1 Tax=Saccharolobus solfataricus TaxID=2287 RepID=Q9UWW7_SACSO|nr:hypothetical protein [Saccharolobus solfataricus P2]
MVISINIASTCISCSKAKYSANVNAVFGVNVFITGGSFAKLTIIATLLIAPVSSKNLRKNRASSYLAPIAAKTTAKLLSSPLTVACLAICAANILAGNPLPLNIGNFCPLNNAFNPSIADIPVCINSSGYSLAAGFNGDPFISLFSPLITGGPLSNESPSGLNIRPNISSEIFTSKPLPNILILVPVGETPVVPSKTCTIAIPI